MYNTDNLGLCCGSVVQADFRGLAEAAGSAGFKSISMWPTLFEAALNSGLSGRDLRAILDDNGLHVSELDPLMSWIPLELDPGDMSAAFYAYSEQDFYRMAEAIGGRTLNFIQYGEDNIGFDHKVDLVSALCELAVVRCASEAAAKKEPRDGAPGLLLAAPTYLDAVGVFLGGVGVCFFCFFGFAAVLFFLPDRCAIFSSSLFSLKSAVGLWVDRRPGVLGPCG